jgi:hypothetical protein
MAGFAAIAALSLHILFAVTFSGLHIAVLPAEFKRMSKRCTKIFNIQFALELKRTRRVVRRNTILSTGHEFFSVLRMRDVYPEYQILVFFTHPGSQMPDPKTVTKERSDKKIVVIPLFVTINFTEFKFFYF